MSGYTPARGYYILDDQGEPVPCDDVLTWAAWFESHARHVGETYLADGAIRVSTVFLGLDHNFGWHGPPVLWETMVFGDWEDHDFDRRYTSRASALAGHASAVAAIEHWLTSRS